MSKGIQRVHRGRHDPLRENRASTDVDERRLVAAYSRQRTARERSAPWSQGACARSCSTVSTLRRWRDFGRPALGYAVREYDDAELERLRAQGIVDPEDDPSVVIDPLDDGPSVWFNRVPEAKAVKNRVHLDVDLDDEADIDRLVAGGARVSRPLGAVPDEMWAILVDPEGNEFCAFPPE